LVKNLSAEEQPQPLIRRTWACFEKVDREKGIRG
jgi:hypothetical protein